MSIETLELIADELGTYAVNIVPTDESTPPQAVPPKTLSWSLTTDSGVIINSRNCIDFEDDDGTGVAGALSTSMTVVPNGPDLQILGTESSATVTRRLNIKYTYDSATLGNDLPVTKEVKFLINNHAHSCS